MHVLRRKSRESFLAQEKTMSDGYNELMNADFFGIREMGVDVNELNLIDRINLYTKAGGSYGIDFTEEEREWIDKVMGTETFDDVVKVTDVSLHTVKKTNLKLITVMLTLTLLLLKMVQMRVTMICQ